MCFTAVLEVDGGVGAGGVAMEELEFPALEGSFAGGRRDEPAGGGGIGGGRFAGRAEEDTDAAAAFGGELQAAGIELGEGGAGSDDGRDRLADHTFTNHCDLIFF